MPRALEPGVQFTLVLKSDADKPSKLQPRFLYRALNGREYRKLAALNEQIEQSGDSGAFLTAIYDALRMGLVGWQNMVDPASGGRIEYEPTAADLDLLIDPFEAAELLELVLAAGQPSAAEKKS